MDSPAVAQALISSFGLTRLFLADSHRELQGMIPFVSQLSLSWSAEHLSVQDLCFIYGQWLLDVQS